MEDKIARYQEIERRGLLGQLPQEKQEIWQEYKSRHPELDGNDFSKEDGNTGNPVLDNSVVRGVVSGLEKVADSNLNPVGVMTKLGNVAFGSGKYELPESLRTGIVPQNATERAISNAIDYGNSALEMYGTAGALKGTGVLSKIGSLGKGKVGKIGEALFLPKNVPLAIAQASSGGATEGIFNPQSVGGKIAANVIGSNPLMPVRGLIGTAKAINKGVGSIASGVGTDALEEAFNIGRKESSAIRDIDRLTKGEKYGIVDSLKNLFKGGKSAEESARNLIEDEASRLGRKARLDETIGGIRPNGNYGGGYRLRDDVLSPNNALKKQYAGGYSSPNSLSNKTKELAGDLEKAETFRENLRGKADITKVVDEAEDALKNIQRKASAKYGATKEKIFADKTKLDTSDIIDTMNRESSSLMFEGVPISDAKAGTIPLVNRIVDAVDRFKGKNTIAGLDAMKRAVQAIDATGDREALRIQTRVVNAIKDTIKKQKPEYAKFLEDYSDAQDLMKDIRQSLKVGTGNKETTTRAITQALRNNVNANFGRKANMLRQLEKEGGKNLVAGITGQELSSALPRGISRLVGAGLAGGSLYNPALLLSLPFSSPRLLGEAMLKLGQGAGKIDPYILQNNIAPYIQGALNKKGEQ